MTTTLTLRRSGPVARRIQAQDAFLRGTLFAHRGQAWRVTAYEGYRSRVVLHLAPPALYGLTDREAARHWEAVRQL